MPFKRRRKTWSRIRHFNRKLPGGPSLLTPAVADLADDRGVRTAHDRTSAWPGTDPAHLAVRLPGELQRLLSESAEVLLSADEPDAMLQAVFRKIAGLLGVDTYFNYIVNEAGDALRLESCQGIPEEQVRRIHRLEFGQAVCGCVALRKEPLVASFIQQSSEPMVQLVKGYGIRAYACNPLLAGSRLLGTLSFATHSRDAFKPEELDFFRTITRYVTSAYERIALIRQLKQADRRKDEFLAMLGHELRNPLAAIATATQLAEWAGPEQVEPCLAIIGRQVRNLTRMIDDLLDVSRITRGNIRLVREDVVLPAVIDRSVEAVRPLLNEHRHLLNVSHGPGTAAVVADATRLEQVFVNLLINAAKYTDPGGRIEVATWQDGEEVVATVRDNGMGIPAEVIASIFGLFARAERSGHRNPGGLGVGLTLVDRIIRLHGGTVTARSDGPGTGAEFEVRLPASRQPMPQPHPEPSQQSLEIDRPGHTRRQ